MKKVTLQDIADSLGVSRISVWKVFSGREGVSDELRKKIIAKASELNYNFPKDFELPDELKSIEHQINISVTVSRNTFGSCNLLNIRMIRSSYTLRTIMPSMVPFVN